MRAEPSLIHAGGRNVLIVTAWISMLLISDLPDIIWKTAFGHVPGWILGAKISFLASFLGLCLLQKKLRPLRPYAFVMIVFFAAYGISTKVGGMEWWRVRFAGPQVSFTLGYTGIYIRDLAIALAVIAALWIVKRRRNAFFLTKGAFDAPIERVPWLGIRSGESWRKFGWIFALVAGFGILVPMVLSIGPTADQLRKALPLLPAVLVFAAVNAFTEEVYYRASLLATLHDVIGKNHTLLINAVFFGLAHWLYGSPPGVPGFLMTAFLAWILGKAMLETKGLFWPWFIHFIPDVVIFGSYAVLWTQR